MGTSGPEQDVTIGDIRSYFGQLNQPTKPVSTEEVAEALSGSRQSVRNRLEDLVNRGFLNSRRIDGSDRIWWASEGESRDAEKQDSKQLSTFISAVKDYAIFRLEPDGTIASWNEGAERIKGYQEDEILGEHFSTFYTEEDIAEDVPENNLKTAAEEGRVEDEGWRVRDDGSRFWANVTITAIRDEAGELQGFTKVTRDMTERREYEQQLQSQAEQLQRQRDELKEELDDIFERIDDAFYALDSEFRFEYVNDRAARYLDTPAGELLGRTPWEAFSVEEDDPVFDKFETALTKQEPLDFERHSEPLEMWVEVRVYPSESGLSVYFSDITERKERESELERTHDLLEKAEQMADIGGWEIDPETLEVFWTEHLFDILALPYEEEPPLAEALDVYLEEDRQIVEDAVGKALETGEPIDIEVRFQTPEGDVRWLRVKGDPEIVEEEVVSLRGAVQDITERKERERELQRVRERMEFALNATDAVVWDWDVEADEASFYPSAESLYGTTIENFEDFIDVVHPEDRETVQESIERTLETGEPEFEATRIVRNGEVRWVESPGHVIQGDDGSTRLVGVARDITERKTYERKLEESNERLEQFAYAASHDLQEPLRMVSSYLQLLDDRYSADLDEDAQEFIEFAVDGANRMQEMIEGLLQYSRVETKGDPFEPVDLDTVLGDVLADLQFKIEEHDAEITINDLPTVSGDASQLRELFQNLLDNAIEYSGEEPPQVNISAERGGSMWEISVRDEGIGIDPKDQDRIFEVFQRLHSREEHEGTGIGLALCKRIVERHGGDITIESEASEGTTFTLTLPAADDQ